MLNIFEWTANHTKEWDLVNRALSEQPVLAIFDPNRDTKLSSDASQDGIGSALLQRHGDGWKPVAYASQVLTSVQKRYSQIEKEAMAVVYGCEKFHHFVYGHKLLLETDHRPLIGISQKAIGDMPSRSQRFFLRLLKYDFTLQVVPAKSLLLADMLSRAPVSLPRNDDAAQDVEVHVVSSISALVSEATWRNLIQGTSEDGYLKKCHRMSSDQQTRCRPAKAVCSGAVDI